MDVTVHFAALHYLNEWKRKEERLYRRFHESKDDNRRTAIADAAAKFGVARTLRKQHDATIQRISKRISKKYGRRQVLSATTKLLWLKFRSPVIIYDRQARKALKLKKVDFGEYWERWQERFKQQHAEIQDACGSLIDVLRYVIDPAVTESEVQTLSRARWFHERVFDSYLWHRGSG